MKSAVKAAATVLGLVGLAWTVALVEALWNLNKADDWEVGSW